MTTSENKKARDYSKEWQQRIKRLKRLNADIDRDQVDAFRQLLKAQGITYTEWLQNKINDEIKDGK
jgi:cephalosporin-C deacetylase-like acetyl esterase